MKYSEFKKAIEEWCKKWNLEALIEEDNYWTVIRSRRIDSQLNIVAMIYNKTPYVLNLSSSGNMDLEHEIINELSKIVTKFANTMPADRTDKEKIYRLKHKYMCMFGDPVYLIEHFATDLFTVDVDDSQYCGNREFTLEEIEEIKKKFDTDLKDFELIEVEDEI